MSCNWRVTEKEKEVIVDVLLHSIFTLCGGLGPMGVGRGVAIKIRNDLRSRT